MTTKTLTIMFTDIKGFTQRTSDSSRDNFNALMDAHERLLTPVFRHFEGRVIKTIGDAFLVCFDSPTDGVLCGLAIQEVLRQHNAAAAEKDRIEVRVAINLGEVELRDHDVFGDAVNVAARLEGVAEAGEVTFTEAVYLAMNRNEVPTTEVGERTFKGVPFPIRVYKVAEGDAAQAKRMREAVKLTKDGPQFEGLRPRRANAGYKIGAAGAAAVAALVVAAVFFSGGARRAKSQARGLLAQGQELSALDVLDRALAKDPADAELRALAVEAARAHVASLEKAQKYDEALGWIGKETAEKAYLQPLAGDVAALQGESLALAGVNGLVHEYELWDKIRDLVYKNPKDAELPYKTARILEARFVPYAELWLFQKSMDLGAHRGDPHVFELCVKEFGEDMPDDHAQDAQTLARKYFDPERRDWARKTAASGADYALLNAWTILEEVGAPEVKDPQARRRAREAVTAMLAKKDLPDSTRKSLETWRRKLSS